jgi:hypothetical protein
MKKPKKKQPYIEVYEAEYGPVPLGKNGKSLYIHHLNGQHNDNRLENLIAISGPIHCWLHRLCKWIPKNDLIRICKGIIEMCEVYDGKTSK